ncbi:MAG: hypothetical protein PVF95_09890, partial [bacterium]
MKRLSLSSAVFLILILPIFAYAYTVDIEIGEAGVSRLGMSASGGLCEEMVGDKIYETRLLPP